MGKTRGEKFDNIKEQIKPLRDILKEVFCVFDKNELHKERTFIFQWRSPEGTRDDFYIIDGKDVIHDDDDDADESMEVMYLWDPADKDEEDERINKYYRNFLGNVLLVRQEYRL